MRMRAGQQQHEGSVQGRPHPFSTPAGESGCDGGTMEFAGVGRWGRRRHGFLMGGGDGAVGWTGGALPHLRPWEWMRPRRWSDVGPAAWWLEVGKAMGGGWW